MGQGAGWTQDVLVSIEQTDPRVFPHLWLRLIEVLCWSLLFSSAIPASPSSPEGWEAAFQHFSSGFSMPTSQLCQGIPKQNPASPAESLWLHNWDSSLSCSLLPSLHSQNILVCAYLICSHNTSVLNSSKLISSSPSLLSCQSPLGASQYAAVYGLCQQCGEIQGLFTWGRATAGLKWLKY